MKLKDLLNKIPTLSVSGDLSKDFNQVCIDSRYFQKGDVFVAIKGTQFDGHQFVQAACDRGASGVVISDDRVVSVRFGGAVIKVKDTRLALESLASNFFGNPTGNIYVAGVTGTNGKTTTTYLIESILKDMFPCIVIGTIDSHFRGESVQTNNTTPDSLELNRLVSQWKEAGAKALAMEVSSHALDQHRVDSIAFDTAVFTNLTRDHLDYHQSMDNYIKAKAKFFKELMVKSPKKGKKAIINCEDSHHLAMSTGQVPTWTYGISKGDFHGEILEESLDKTVFRAITPKGKEIFELKLIGRHNVQNALAAIAVGVHSGQDLKKLVVSLGQLTHVPGRLERVNSKAGIRVFVDYAHSDDALKNVLQFLCKMRELEKSPAKIITVFGCGGNRDQGKRPKMMRAVYAHSDLSIVTSDNPRLEDPEQIIQMVLTGLEPESDRSKVLVESDRRNAIQLAMRRAQPGDIVLIAGKGHEKYQLVGTKKIAFDDCQVAREILGK